MNNFQNQIKSTIQYYDQHIVKLYDSYENADMLPLQKLLLSHLSPQIKVLDIGFGSGRDLAFLQKHGLDIWGIDPSPEFVKRAKQRFGDIENHFAIGSLPSLNAPTSFYKNFDAVILIAVWMHIPRGLYEDAVREVCSLLRPNARVVISYSVTPRIGETERYFEDVDSSFLQKLFEDKGCKKIADSTNGDGLNNRAIVWKTEVYRNDQS